MLKRKMDPRAAFISEDGFSVLPSAGSDIQEEALQGSHLFFPTQPPLC